MKFKQVTQGGDVYGYVFRCPGCADTHVVPTTGPNAWQFNGDVERPTLSPSILVYERKGPASETLSPRCHSFVRDGRIEFLGDCGHAMAGQTVELSDAEGIAI